MLVLSCMLFIQTCMKQSLDKSWFKMMLYVFKDVRISVRMAGGRGRPNKTSQLFMLFFFVFLVFSSNLGGF